MGGLLTGLRRAAASILVALLACRGGKTTVTVAEDDREMNAAMQQARDELTVFVERLQNPQANDRQFSVKVPLRDGDQVEHFWLEAVRHDNGVFQGTLGNDPELVQGHRYGEPVSVSAKEISDWMFVDRDRLVGGFTIRVIRNRMSPTERSELENGLDFKID